MDEEAPRGLVDSICRPQGQFGSSTSFQNSQIEVPEDRQHSIIAAIGSWKFSAHDFNEDELLWAAVQMLQHAFSLPDLEPYRISTERLTDFLTATRVSYNANVPYHNFRHVIDVTQAVFTFLVRIQALPPFCATNGTSSTPKPSTPSSPRVRTDAGSLIRPFDALTLLITAVGHDVGHPGVNNAFLVNLNAPLAQLYNDQSVLESYHCAAYSQILRHYWPAVFGSKDMRKLLIASILATDMQLHFDYMKKMGWAQEKIADNPHLDTWEPKAVQEHRRLFCSLLIKCADISNVARPFEIAAKWADILTDEFSRQAELESELKIPSALFAPPVKDSIVALGKSQIGFMNLFALPLFQGVKDLMPSMSFAVDEMHANQFVWQSKIDEEQALLDESATPLRSNGALSPRSGSPSVQARKHAKSRSSIHSSSNRASKNMNGDSKDAKSGSRRASSIITITQIDSALDKLLPNGSRKSSAGTPDGKHRLSSPLTNGFSPFHSSRRSSRHSMLRQGMATVEPTRVYATVLPSKAHDVSDLSPYDQSSDFLKEPDRSQSLHPNMTMGHSKEEERIGATLSEHQGLERSYSTPPTIEELTASMGKAVAIANLDDITLSERIRSQARYSRQEFDSLTSSSHRRSSPTPPDFRSSQEQALPLKRKSSKWRVDKWFKNLASKRHHESVPPVPIQNGGQGQDGS